MKFQHFVRFFSVILFSITLALTDNLKPKKHDPRELPIYKLPNLADTSYMKRITFNSGWDGMGAFSPDGEKMVYTRGEPRSWSLYSHIMDVLSLNLGPENYKGVPLKSKLPLGWVENPANFAEWR